MLCKNFYIGSNNYTAYAHKYGLESAYTPVDGLPPKYTMDGTLHDDVLTDKATYTIKFNPVTPAVAKAILNAYRTQATMTIWDEYNGANKTIAYKRARSTAVPALVKGGNVVMVQLSDLVFQEK
jgi:hypothetical protein